MKINLLIIVLFSLISCKKDKYTNPENLNVEKNVLQEGNKPEIKYTSKGYEVLKQKCYICHFEKPNPLKREDMISPPMLRVQEHYKPSYPEKTEFVSAVMAFVKNPSIENTLMPGAVKKFGLMPKLVYSDSELRLIAETIYDYDFGSAPKRGVEIEGGTLKLNKGKKWVLKKASIKQIDTIVSKLERYKPSNIEDYNQFGEAIFNEAKRIMLDDSYTGEVFDQIHVFFFGVEGNIHGLIAAKSESEAETQLIKIKEKFKEFYHYFE